MVVVLCLVPVARWFVPKLKSLFSARYSGCTVRLRMAGNMWKFFIRLAPVFEIMAVLMLGTVVDMLWRALSLPIYIFSPGLFVVFFSAYGLRRKYGNWRWGDFGLRRLKTFKETVLYGVMGLAIVEIIIAVPLILMAPQLLQIGSSLLGGFKDIPMPDFLLYATLGALFIAAVYAAIPEEIQYRGYMQGLTSKYMGKPWAVLMIALMFMVVHCYSGYTSGYIPMVLMLFPSSLMFGVLYQKTGSLYPSMVMHFLGDFLVLIPVGLYVKEYYTLAYLLTPIYLVASLVIIYFQKERAKELVRETIILLKGLKTDREAISVGVVSLASLILIIPAMEYLKGASIVLTGSIAALLILLTIFGWRRQKRE